MQAENEYDELVISLVESALERPAAEQEEYLRVVCRADTKLYEEVRSRVEWELRMGNFLLEPLLATERPRQLFEPGALLADRFRIVREVGSGGMGVVYEAVDETLDRRVAIKCAKPGFHNRLPPEARTAREVSHFNVCKVHDLHAGAAPWGKVDFLSMEFIDGETLSDRLKRDVAIPETQARDVARQVCAGLAQAHRQGVIHGDLKPGNVLLTQSPEGRLRAVITDFGLAKLQQTEGGPHVMSERGGTADYMAPELFRGGRASVASDVYALGVLFHQMITGRTRGRPDPNQATLLMPGVEPGRRQMEELPSPWNAVVMRCLAVQPEDRYGSADQVLDALDGRRPVIKWAIAAMLALIAVLALMFWQRGETTGPPIRLAVLPFSVAGEGVDGLAVNGIASDVANRLSGLRKNVAVISPRDVVQNQVRTVQDARSALGATHVLDTSLRSSGNVILASAALYDASSGRAVRELKGSYSTNDGPVLAKALIATVTSALRLPSKIALEVVSPPAYPYYVQGIALVQRDRVSADEAMPLFQKAIALDQRSALPYAGLAEAQLQKFSMGYGHEWLDQAQQTVAKANSLNPDAVAVLLASGLLHQEQGAYEQAVREFNRAAELEPNSSDASRRLATVYNRMNRPEDAIVMYQKAIAVQPGYYRHYSDFFIFYYNRGRYREAEDLIRRVTELAPNLDSGHGDLGVLLMGQGRYGEAEAAMLTALRLRETEQNLNNLGALYNYEGRDPEAIRFYEKSLAVGPPSIALYLNLGDTYRRLGRGGESRDVYHRGRALAESEVVNDPRKSLSRAFLALFSARLGDAGRAEFEIAQALRMAPDDSKVMRYAALTYEVMKQRDKTLEVLRNAPATLLGELNRQPDLKDLQEDRRFMEFVLNKPMP